MTKGQIAEIETCTGATPQLQPRRHLLFCQGDESDFIHIVKDGWVVLYELLEDGRKQVLKFAGPGSVLGFMPVGSRYMTCTAECITTVVLSVIPRSRFDRVLRDRSDLAMWLASSSVRDLETTFRRLTVVGRCSARERVAYLLVDLACPRRRSFRDSGPDCDILIPPVTRQHIADALGLSSEHISRVFRGFKDEGLIAACRSRIKVLDLRHLAAVAGRELEVAAA